MGRFSEICVALGKHKYALYVLTLMMLTYLVNQFKTFSVVATNISMAQEIHYGEKVCDAKTGNYPQNVSSDLKGCLDFNSSATSCCNKNEILCDNVISENSLCYWKYTGQGTDYQLLVGPMYIIVFSLSGIPLGLISELNNINRKLCLVLCMVAWSVMTMCSALATEYWHLAVARFLSGIFSAGCVPFCTSIIADYFGKSNRGAALGFFNWGVFVGYSLAFLLILADRQFGWRAAFVISGLPGVILGIIVAFSVKEPERRSEGQREKELSASFQLLSMVEKLKTAFTCFTDPVLLMLCFSGAVRNGAGLVWAYNILLYFNEYWPDVSVERYMSWIPLVFGSTAVFGGGYLSDRLARRRGVKGRLLVLIFCCFAAAPFQAAVLFLPPPWCFVSHVIGILVGEMWLGVCAAIVIELSPTHLTTSCVALYFFIIQVIGGNMNLFVTPITHNLNLRLALLITFPGLYIIGGLGFLATLMLHVRQNKSRKQHECIDGKAVDDVSDVKKPLSIEIEIKSNDGKSSDEPLLHKT